MADTRFKVPSQNNSPLIVAGVVQNDIVDFKVSNKVLNLNESYLTFECNITETTPANLHNLALSFDCGDGTRMAVSNIPLVKDCYVFCGNKGKVEEKLDADCINNLMYKYVVGNSSKYYSRKGHLFPQVDKFTTFVADNPFRVLDKVNPAQQVTVEGRLYLRDVLEFCRQKEIDLNKWGELHLYFKLNLAQIAPFENLGNVSVNPSIGGSAGNFRPFWGNGTAGALNGAMNDIAQTNNAVATITTARTYETLENAPYWIGQALSITKTIAGATTTTAHNVLTLSILTTGVIQITLDTNLKAAGVNQAITAISVVGTDITNANLLPLFNMPKCELVCKEVVRPSKGSPTSVELLSYYLEKDNNAGQTHKRTYELPAGVVGVVVAFPNTILSKLTALENDAIKISVNNEDITQGIAISYNHPIEKDLKEKFFKNLGMNLASLQLQSYTHDREPTNEPALMFPVPESTEIQTFNLDIVAGNAIGNINIYKYYLNQV